MPLDEAIRIILAVATALDYAHQHGMVHRDIKPANIMFTEDGQVILTDFGIARMVNTVTLTASGAMVGTPAYMAPEQGSRTGDERADIYSLGVVLYQLATGTLPFEADTPLGIILKHINAPLTPPTAIDPDLSPSIEAVIMRALVKDPDNRYQTAREFATDLEKCLAGEPVEPVPLELVAAPPPSGAMAALPGHSTTPYPQAIAAARPKRGWIAVLAGVVALILLFSAALLTTETPGRLLAALLSQGATSTPGVSGTPAGTPAETPTPDLTATYDVNATQFAVWMATYVATTGVTPTPSPNPTATATPDLTATAMAACVFDMEAIYDLSLIHISEPTRRYAISYAVFCLKKKTPAEPFHFSVPFVVEWRDTRDGRWWAEVGLTAWGGQGNYRYYLNYISEETEFFNGTFEIRSLNCRGWWGTVIVTSCEEVQRWEGKIPYPELEQCSD